MRSRRLCRTAMSNESKDGTKVPMFLCIAKGSGWTAAIRPCCTARRLQPEHDPELLYLEAVSGSRTAASTRSPTCAAAVSR